MVMALGAETMVPFAASPNGRGSRTRTSGVRSTRSLMPARICRVRRACGVGVQICRRRPLFHNEDGLAVGVQGEQFTSRLLVHKRHYGSVYVDNPL